MWNYTDVTRVELEAVKDHVEEIMIAHGAVVQNIDLPYTQKTTTIQSDSNSIVCSRQRNVFKHNGLYYRVDEICCKSKPFIVVEVGTYHEVINNIMEDTEPFPWDLSDEKIDVEVSYILGEKPYPTEC